MAALPYEALLLVDGYNVIGAWNALQETRDSHSLEIARDELIEILLNYTAQYGYKAKVVFDAHYQQTPIKEEEYGKYLTVCYTAFAQTADSYIEKVCASFRDRLSHQFSRLIVVTSDQAQRHTVVGYGAEWMSSQKFQRAVAAATQRTRDRQKAPRSNRGRFLFNSLDPNAQQLLQRLRHGL